MIQNWLPPEKPADLTEKRLIAGILKGNFPADSLLPAERELAEQLGVTRPTLREVLQRMARDGWLEIRQGKPTRVRDYWREGNLAVLSSIAAYQEDLPDDFVPNLLYTRILIAPTYTRQAVEKAPGQVALLVKDFTSIAEDPQAFASFDYNLHRQLTLLAGNTVFTLFMNSVRNLYAVLAPRYFMFQEARVESRLWYAALQECAEHCDGQEAQLKTEQVMRKSLQLWNQTTLFNSTEVKNLHENTKGSTYVA